MAGALHVGVVLDAQEPRLPPRSKARASERMEPSGSGGVTAERVPHRARDYCLSCLARGVSGSSQTIGTCRLSV
jgi:hypothetical protein